MEEFLSDFVCEYRSSKQDHARIAEHWDTLFWFTNSTDSQDSSQQLDASPMVLLFDNFYKFLFGLVPEVRSMFRSSMHPQGKALMRITGAVRSMLESPDLIAEASYLAQRHIHYGVLMEHYNPLGVALMKTLETCSAALRTPETTDAWKRVHCHVSLVVLTEMAKQSRKKQWSSLLPSILPNLLHTGSSAPNVTKIRVATKYAPQYKSASASHVGDCPFSSQPGAELPPGHPPIIKKSATRRKGATNWSLAEYISRSVGDLFMILTQTSG